MVNRSVQGTGLGAKSFESEAGIAFAPRVEIEFACHHEHHFTVVFAQGAEMPMDWICPRCGVDALRTDGQRAIAKEEKPGRTHWDMLRERRSVAELEHLLAERLALLRADRRAKAMAASEVPTAGDAA